MDEPPVGKEESLSIPEHYKLTKSAEIYLGKTRRLDPRIWKELPIFSTEKGILFLFPGEDYWQIRRWSHYTPPKWENPTGIGNRGRTSNDGVVYLVERFPHKDEVVLVEGIFDAIAVASFNNAAAVLSSHLHPAQALQLSRRFSHAKILMDEDVPFDVDMENLITAKTHFISAESLDIYGGDPADVQKFYLREIVV